MRLDRAMSVSDFVWVSMETGRIDQLKFGSVVVLPDDALVGGARWLMPLPGGGYIAAQWILSSCINPNLRAAVAKKTREELDLENLREKFTGLTGAGNRGGTTPGAREGVDGEGTSAAKGGLPKTARSRPGGSDAMTANQASGIGTTTGRIKSWGDGYGVVLDSLFPLPLVHELGPRPQGRKRVRAWLCDKRREEDVNALISSLNWCAGSRAPFAVDSVTSPRQNLVIARLRELVDRSLPMFAISGQREDFLKLLRARRRTYPDQFSFCVKNLVASDHRGISPC